MPQAPGQLVGNITDDPELRYTQGGAALAGFTVAVSHRRWVPSSIGSASQTAISTAKAKDQNVDGSSRAASQPSGSEDRRRSDQKHNGEWQDVTDGFFRCTAWRSVAENAAKSLHKGDRVMVVGKLIQRSFEVEGQKRTTVEVQVQHVAPDLQFATAEITKPSTSDSPAPVEQTA